MKIILFEVSFLLVFSSTATLCPTTDHLIADEFSAELADGIAYVAGQDEESRPVMVRIYCPEPNPKARITSDVSFNLEPQLGKQFG